ncbi:MAG: SDR family NAD(P)-dependent oxidoreductase [Synechococcales bacterium]|nr:SDR family NAD(P)-dependent oxidoreductase [Synechococcales bacterium]
MIQSGDRTAPTHQTNYRDLLREATLQIRSLRSELDAVRQQQNEPIAIIGMACRFPGGANTPEAYWELLRNGIDAITEIPPQRWNVAALYDPDAEAPGKMYTRCGGFIDGIDQFDPQFFGISPREAHSLDPQQRLLLETSYTALENAGQPPFDLRGSRTGVFVGVSFDDYAQLSVRSGDLTQIDAHSSLGNTRSLAAGRLAYTFGFQGPTMQLDTTCSSSLLAVHLACQSLRNGEANLALAGGVNLMLSPEPTIGFCKLKALAPDGRCKTFDAAADGYGRGEGCGVVVLKRLSDAIDNQDPILALVRGSAVNHDGCSNGLTAPNGAAQAAVLRQALANAGLDPHQVQYVEVHGTGTRLGDPIEVLALNQVMGQRPSPLLVGSVKTNIGHLESAAGVAGLIKVILSLHHQQIPPHLHLQTPNPHIPWDQLAITVPTQLTPWPATDTCKRAGISSFGMSGTNVHIILEEAPQEEGSGEWGNVDSNQLHQRPLHLLILSARSEEALQQLAQRYRNWLNSPVEAALPDICFSASVGRSHFNHRLALVTPNLSQLCQQLETYLNGNPSSETITQSINLPHPKIAFLFTGQGSQYPHMGQELYETEPTFRRTIDQCAEILVAEGIDLLEVLYGKDEGRKQKDESGAPFILHSSSSCLSSYAQPALFALEYALAQLWRSWGIEFDGLMGHSVGEYVAACLAEVFSLEDGLRLVMARGRLMQQLPEGGGMVAVMTSVEQLSGMLPEGVTIAAVNGPEASVISGDLQALASVVSALTEQGIQSKPLQVSHAFHSALMEPMLAEFWEVANTVSYALPQVELISNVTGQLASPKIASAEYWVNHIRQPVQFAAGMQALAVENYDIFIEIGPKPVLLSLGQTCLPEIDALWLPSLRPEADWQTLLASLGQLYVAGATIDWAGFERSHPHRMIQLPNYPFQRQRYWMDSDSSTPYGRTAVPIHPYTHPPIHPLLGSPLPLAGETVRYFQAQLHQNSPSYLKDHRVFEAVVMPAASYLESAIAAAHAFLPTPLVLHDVSLIKSLILPETESVLVQTVVTRLPTGDSEFEIFSQGPSPESTWQCHARGAIKSGDDQPTQFPLAAKQVELTDEVDPATFYDLYQRRGIAYGPQFRILTWIRCGSGEALAQIRLVEEQWADLKNYHLYPVLLDAGLQLAGATLDQQLFSATYLPVGLERLRLYQAENGLPEWVYAKLRHSERTETDQPDLVIDVQLLDVNGWAIATINGLRLHPASPQSLSAATYPSNPAEATWLYQVDWQLQPLPTQATNRLQPPETICNLIAPYFTELISQPEFVEYQALLPQLDDLSLDYAAQALTQLGWSPQLDEAPNSQNLAANLKIAPQHQKFFKRLLEEGRRKREEGGRKKEEGRARSQESGVRSQEPKSTIHNPQSTIPALLTRCGENLAAVLRGEVDPLALLFPEGDFSDLMQLYERSPGAQVMNSLVQRAVMAAIAPSRHPLRILEIGAGTGGTTAYLLPHLRDVEYVFTDVSPLFLTKAQERFQDYSFVSYELLNIERSPAEQGFQQPFDLVIAANVLHATTDLRQTLTHVRHLLAPGGELILLEGTQSLVWLDLIFGLTEGWWKFTDYDLRPHHPLLSAHQWLELLEQSGFTTAILQPESSPRRLGRAPAKPNKAISVGFHDVQPDLPQTVMMAQRNEVPGSTSAVAAHWLILAESSEMGRPLRNYLLQQGWSSLLVQSDLFGANAHGRDKWPFASTGFASRLGSTRNQDELFLDWSAPDLEAQLLQILQMEPCWRGIVYLTETAVESDRLPEISGETCRRGLHLVQAMIKANLSPAPRLYFVTQGATAPGITEAGLARSPLWGLAKTVALEHPEFRCTCLDLARTGVEPLAAELLADSPEPQVCLQLQQRRVARLQPLPIESTAPSVRLMISEPGTLANLTFQPVGRRSPTADEIEIRVAATGLNFRDVLTALGQYPGEPTLGCECAGEVVAVGKAVQDLAVGQQVMGIAPGSFGQYVTVHRAMVVPIPDGITPEAAATIPVAFLTAHYSLVHLAQLTRDDCLLIHAAAGGVGQAAIQIAQSINAEIVAIASPGKWETLRALGITYTLNSRTLDFADEVMTLTHGQGVDVVLNSLTGEFRKASLGVLRQGGRFVELGLDQEPVPAGKDYFAVNLVALCQEQPHLIQSMLQALSQQFVSGVLHPLPQTSFPLEEAAEAFRTMQQTQHVGKIVLVVGEDKRQKAEEGRGKAEGRRQKAEKIQNPKSKVQNLSPHSPIPPSPHPLFLPDGTYLLTGGTGGLGLRTAGWMIAHGAQHLLLISRREPMPDVRAQIQAWGNRGVTVETMQVDVGDVQALAAVLRRIAESPHPLRGVVHGAGVLSDGRLSQLSWPQFERVLAPKVQGAWNLHRLTQDLPLDFFVMFSSAAALLGSPGQANHAAANAFLDGLAHYRRSHGLPGLSLNWGAWSEIGSALKYQQRETLAGLQGVGLISPEQGLQQLEQVWVRVAPQIGIVPIQWSEFLRQGNLRQSPFLEAFRQEKSPRPTPSAVSFRQRLATTPAEQQRSLLDAHVCAQISQTLGFAPDELDRQRGFFDLGLDSLTAMELKNSLQSSLGCSLPATLAFDYPTVERLLDYLADQILPKAEPAAVADPEEKSADWPFEADLAAQLDQKLADLEDLMGFPLEAGQD